MQLTLPNGIRSRYAFNTHWYYKVTSDSEVKPKDFAIEQGIQAGHTLFFERQECQSNYRSFGSYKSLEAFSDAVRTQNIHLYEIIPEHLKNVKFYADIDGETDVLQEVLDILCHGFEEEFGIHLTPEDFHVSAAHGVSDFHGQTGIMKYSYHVVCSKHETLFKDKKNIQYFLTKYHHPAIDLAVYNKNQSFKTIYQSKLGASHRVQTPLSGGYCEHLVTYISDIPKKVLSCKRVVKDIETRLKEQTLSPSVIPLKRAKNPVFPKDTFDKHSIQDLLELLPNSGEDEQAYHVWFVVMCVCKNENEPVESFVNWSRAYSGFVESDVLKRYQQLRYKPDGFTIRTLQYLVSKANPMVFKNYDEKFVHQICYPTLDFVEHNVHHETIHSRYLPKLSKYFQKISDDEEIYKHLVVKSFLGTGKSTQNNVIIEDLQPSSILVVSSRILFCYSIVGTIRKVCPQMVIYREVDIRERPIHPFMACQVESLHTINTYYDLVIVDESESVLNQFTSTTNEKHFKSNVKAFDTIIRNAKHVIWSDAFVTDRTMLTVSHFAEGSPIKYVHNTWKPEGRKRIYVGKKWDALANFIKHKLSDFKTVTISSNTALVHYIKDNLPNVFALYSGCDDETKYTLISPDDAVRDKQHLVYTCSLNVGTDIQVPFDYRCVYLGANSAVARDLFQAMERVRNFTKNETFYTLYSVNNGEKGTDVFDRTRIDTILSKRYANDMGTTNLLEQFPWVRKVFVMNMQEQNVSTNCFSKVCDEYFRNCGYVHAEIDKNTLTDTELANMTVESASVGPTFADIIDVDLETYSKYYLDIQCGRASEITKLIVLKYYFKHFVIKNPESQDTETLELVWKGFLSNKQRMIDRVCNIRYEIGYNGSSDPLFNNRANKLKHIKDICESLGIKNTYTRAKIERSMVEATCEKILQVKTEIKEQFDIPLGEEKAGKATTLKRGVKLLNAVLERWGFTTIKADSVRKQKRINGKVTDTTPFLLDYGCESGKVVGESHVNNTPTQKNVQICSKNDERGCQQTMKRWNDYQERLMDLHKRRVCMECKCNKVTHVFDKYLYVCSSACFQKRMQRTLDNYKKHRIPNV